MKNINEKFYDEFCRKRSSPPNKTIKYGPKLKRNDTCPCGSGKKYKKCCRADLENAAKHQGNPLVQKEQND